MRSLNSDDFKFWFNLSNFYLYLSGVLSRPLSRSLSLSRSRLDDDSRGDRSRRRFLLSDDLDLVLPPLSRFRRSLPSRLSRSHLETSCDIFKSGERLGDRFRRPRSRRGEPSSELSSRLIREEKLQLPSEEN